LKAEGLQLGRISCGFRNVAAHSSGSTRKLMQCRALLLVGARSQKDDVALFAPFTAQILVP